jgi:hypothetical protein
LYAIFCTRNECWGVPVYCAKGLSASGTLGTFKAIAWSEGMPGRRARYTRQSCEKQPGSPRISPIQAPVGFPRKVGTSACSWKPRDPDSEPFGRDAKWFNSGRRPNFDRREFPPRGQSRRRFAKISDASSSCPFKFPRYSSGAERSKTGENGSRRERGGLW